jgi:hypothetical protein
VSSAVRRRGWPAHLQIRSEQFVQSLPIALLNGMEDLKHKLRVMIGSGRALPIRSACLSACSGFALGVTQTHHGAEQ